MKNKSKKFALAVQQGDVTMVRLAEMPKGDSKTVSRKRCVLAEGEKTGHAHVVEDGDAELIKIGERMLLKLTKAATVTHEEHKPITLQPGIWEIGQVSEYDYLNDMARTVQD